MITTTTRCCAPLGRCSRNGSAFATRRSRLIAIHRVRGRTILRSLRDTTNAEAFWLPTAGTRQLDTLPPALASLTTGADPSEIYASCSRVRASVTTTAYPDQPLEGRVSFINPQLNASTRTAKIRVEVANMRGAICDSACTPTSRSRRRAPRRCSSFRKPRFKVLVTDKWCICRRRMTREGCRARNSSSVLGDQVEVLAGLSAGDLVVSKGSFFVRAEAERLGLRASQPSPSGSASTATGTIVSAGVQVAEIAVTEKGFEPDKVSLRAGVHARATFLRTTDKTSRNPRGRVPLAEHQTSVAPERACRD